VAGLACSLAGKPSVSVNQLGYLPHSIKVGVAQSAANTPLEWHVVDASDDSVASGKTQVGGSDEDSGAMLHRADFSALTAPGKNYRLVVDGASSYRFSIDARVYRSLELSALNFFYQMRSGTPIEIP